MTFNYLKLIFRNLINRKSFTLINLLGLSMAFAVCIIILLYVYTELSFDKSIPDVRNKYRITIRNSDEQKANLPYNLKDLLKPQLPVGSKLAVVTTSSEYTTKEVLIGYNRNLYKFTHLIFTDSRILPILGISLLEGSADCYQQSPNQILLSQKTAQTIFGNKNAIGQMLKYGNMNYTVSGLFRDLASNTHLPVELISLRPLDWKFTYEQENSWGYNLFDYYLWLPAHSKVTDIESTIKNIYLSAHPDYKNASQKEKDNVSFKLEPITDIHLYSAQLKWDNNKIKGSIGLIISFIIIGLLILLMATFNYINLSTAYFQTKNTFSGNLKVFGASSAHLYQYIYLQTTLIVMFGLIGSLGIVRVLLPIFNVLVSRQIAYSLLLNPVVAGIGLTIISLVTLLAGLYPAIRFSNQTPAKALMHSSSMETSLSKSFIRKAMVVSQFTISIGLMIIILVMGRQIRLMSQQRLGFNAEQLIEIKSYVSKNEFNLLKSRLERVSNVAGVSIANYNQVIILPMVFQSGYPVLRKIRILMVQRLYGLITIILMS